MRHALWLLWLCWSPLQADETCEAVTDPESRKKASPLRTRGDAPANTPGGLGDEAGLITFHLATDGRRWQVSHVLPDRVSGDMQMVGEHIDGGVLSRFRRADEEMVLVLRSLQGTTKTFVARPGQQWQLFGPVEDARKARVTCLGNIRRSATAHRMMALGHRGGLVSLWQFEAAHDDAGADD